VPGSRTRPRDARVAFARVVSVDPTDSIYELRARIDAALHPGTAIERYGREWRMGQNRRDGEVVIGRIGYQRPGELAELWDDDANDFRETRLVDGLTSPFALNLENFALVFQLRSGRIKHTSFTGAFQALLNHASGDTLWRVRPIVQGVDWERWEGAVTRVRHIEFKLERPNPNYHGRGQVERIIEGANARLARLVLDADPADPDGIDITDALVRESIEHAIGDYGTVKAIGDIRTDEGIQESVWRSDIEGSPIETRVPVDPETREANPEALRDELPQSGPDLLDQELRDEFVAPPPADTDDDE